MITMVTTLKLVIKWTRFVLKKETMPSAGSKMTIKIPKASVFELV